MAAEGDARVHSGDNGRRPPPYEVDLLIAQPILRHLSPAAAIAVDLAALNREALIRAARVALHLPELHSEEILQHGGVGSAGGATCRRAHEEFLLARRKHVLPIFHPTRTPDVTDADVLADIADPGIRAEVGLHVRWRRQGFVNES